MQAHDLASRLGAHAFELGPLLDVSIRFGCLPQQGSEIENEQSAHQIAPLPVLLMWKRHPKDPEVQGQRRMIADQNLGGDVSHGRLDAVTKQLPANALPIPCRVDVEPVELCWCACLIGTPAGPWG